MVEQRQDLKARTKKYAVSIIKLAKQLDRDTTNYVIAKQIIRSASSVGANYRSASRAKSRADFVAKMGIVEEELDETMYWLEIMIDLEILSDAVANPFIKESGELLAIVVSSINTARGHKR